MIIYKCESCGVIKTTKQGRSYIPDYISIKRFCSALCRKNRLKGRKKVK